MLFISTTVFTDANNACIALLFWSNGKNSSPSTFRKSPAKSSADIALIYLSVTGLNTFEEFFIFEFFSLSKEMVLPFMNIQSLFASNDAAITTSDSSTSFGTPIMNGATKFSGRAVPFATIATGESRLSRQSYIGVFSIPSSFSCRIYEAIRTCISEAAEAVTGPHIIITSSVNPATQELSINVNLILLRSCTGVHTPFADRVLKKSASWPSSATSAQNPKFPSAASNIYILSSKSSPQFSMSPVLNKFFIKFMFSLFIRGTSIDIRAVLPDGITSTHFFSEHEAEKNITVKTKTKDNILKTNLIILFFP